MAALNERLHFDNHALLCAVVGKGTLFCSVRRPARVFDRQLGTLLVAFNEPQGKDGAGAIQTTRIKVLTGVLR